MSIYKLYGDAFSGLPRDVWLISAVALVNRSGTMVLPFLGLYLTVRMNFDRVEAGAVLAAFGVGSVVGSYAGGVLCKRFRAVRVQEFALWGGGVGFFALVFLHSLAALVAGVFAMACVNDMFRPAVMIAMAEASPPDLRTRSLALLRLAINMGMTLGPSVGGLLARFDYRWLFAIDGATCWLSAVLLRASLGSPRGAPAVSREGPGGHQHPRHPLRDPLFLRFLLIMFLMAMVFLQLLSTMPLFFREHYGMDEFATGLVFGSNALLVALAEMVIVRRLEHLPPMRLVSLGCLLVGCGFALIPLGSTVWFALFTVVVWTVGEMLMFPFSNSLASSWRGAYRCGEYMGLYTATFSVALMLSPPAGMWAYERFGGQVIWGASGVVGVLLWAESRLLEAKLARGRVPPSPTRGEKPRQH